MVDIASIKSGAKGAEKKAKEKVAKVRLTKEQARFVQEMVKLENRIAVCREFITLWTNFFRFFAEDLSEKEITPEEEKAFFQALTQVARKHFTFVELMGDTFERGGDIINAVLCNAVSLSYIQAMPPNTFSKLQLDWHSLFLDMNKALGRLLRMLPGNMPLSEALAAMEKTSPLSSKPGSPAAKIRGGTSDKKKLLAAILALPPFGVLGLDCFYLGLTKMALLRIVTLGGLGIWALVDFVRILAGKMEDAEGKPLA